MSWIPICELKKIKEGKLYREVIESMPYVFFKYKGEISVFKDMCPHRGYPLSLGNLKEDVLTCKFHGWQMNSNGEIIKIPGFVEQKKHSCQKSKINIKEYVGLLWVNQDNEPWQDINLLEDNIIMTSTVKADSLSIYENFLDPFHTHTVHSNIVRKDIDRQKVTVEIISNVDSLEVIYTNEGKQNGFISRFFEKERVKTEAIFKAPNMATLKYYDSNGTSLIVLMYVEKNDGGSKVRVIVSTRKMILPKAIKNCLIKNIFKIVGEQDKKYVEESFKNVDYNFAPLVTPLDFVYFHLKNLLNEGGTQESYKKLEVMI